eukprot:TRINITY_DN3957_c0_g1_i2.p1 TRINITY_DN3957_c0_g1~~TRINITY_DN3957_c0_g1_i2.p1  ORF type:complete len:117 (+),score=14.93 TRINITY_DN3957_c0_g1_i2:614-964(+)
MELVEVDRITVHVLVDFECDPYSTAPKFQNYLPEGQRWALSEIKKYEEATLSAGSQGSSSSHVHTVPESIGCIGGDLACCSSTGFAYLINLYKGEEKYTVMSPALGSYRRYLECAR